MGQTMINSARIHHLAPAFDLASFPAENRGADLWRFSLI